MKRLILGLVAGAFLTLTGVQAAHSHDHKAADSCQICVLGAQMVRHAPAPAPTLKASATTHALPEKPKRKPRSRPFFRTSARAPPAV